MPPANSKLGRFFRYGDLWLVGGLLGTVLLADPAGAAICAGHAAGHQHRAVAVDAAGDCVCEGTVRLHGFSRVAAVHHAVPALAERGLDAPDPAGRLRGPYHRSLRQFRRARQLRGRAGRVPDPGAHQFHRHHQGRRPHRGSRRALHVGRVARQTNGHRRRAERRPDQGRRGPRPPPPRRTGSRLLRGHGRRQQICARRRHRRHSDHADQCAGRVRRRHHAKGHDGDRVAATVHAAVHRRRSGVADPCADHLNGRRHPDHPRRVQEQSRPGPVTPIAAVSAGDHRAFGNAGGDGADPRAADHAVPDAGLRHRRPGLRIEKTGRHSRDHGYQ